MKVKTDFLLKIAIFFVSGMIILLLFSSCNRYALYQSGAKSGTSAPANDKAMEKMLASGDKLSLSIWGHDDLSVGSIHSVYSSPEESGKWLMMDDKGEVNFPQIGKVKLEGLTLIQAEEKLIQLYSQFIQKPVINLRLLSNQVTVLGEVHQPGMFTFSTDHMRLVDMLGKAGGLTDYAKSKELKIIRGTETIIIDLTSAANNEILVYPRDVIYAPPGGNKSVDRFAAKLIPFASLITAVALIYSITEN